MDSKQLLTLKTGRQRLDKASDALDPVINSISDMDTKTKAVIKYCDKYKIALAQVEDALRNLPGKPAGIRIVSCIQQMNKIGIELVMIKNSVSTVRVALDVLKRDLPALVKSLDSAIDKG